MTVGLWWQLVGDDWWVAAGWWQLVGGKRREEAEGGADTTLKAKTPHANVGNKDKPTEERTREEQKGTAMKDKPEEHISQASVLQVLIY